MRRPGPFLLLGLSAAASGCEMAWDIANRGTLERDVRAIFKRHGADLRGGTCHMIGATRAGYCVFRPSPQEVAALVAGLGLHEIDGGGAPGEGTAFRPLEFDRGCRALPPFRKGTPAQAYGSTHRPASLRVSDGVAFDYLLLFTPPASGEICAQVSYSYG